MQPVIATWILGGIKLCVVLNLFAWIKRSHLVYVFEGEIPASDHQQVLIKYRTILVDIIDYIKHLITYLQVHSQGIIQYEIQFIHSFDYIFGKFIWQRTIYPTFLYFLCWNRISRHQSDGMKYISKTVELKTNIAKRLFGFQMLWKPTLFILLYSVYTESIIWKLMQRCTIFKLKYAWIS